jgi:two-component SAPR family response regulator
MPHRKKLLPPFDAVMIVDPDPLHLENAARVIREMKVAKNILSFNSGIEALDHLLLTRQAIENKKWRYPELILADLSFPYHKKRSFLNDLVLMYTDPRTRPHVVSMGCTRPYSKHPAIHDFILKPVDGEKFNKALEEW